MQALLTALSISQTSLGPLHSPSEAIAYRNKKEFIFYFFLRGQDKMSLLKVAFLSPFPRDLVVERYHSIKNETHWEVFQNYPCHTHFKASRLITKLPYKIQYQFKLPVAIYEVPFLIVLEQWTLNLAKMCKISLFQSFSLHFFKY